MGMPLKKTINAIKKTRNCTELDKRSMNTFLVP